jgi:hypothetical protein
MPTSTAAPAPARPAADLNAEIRGLCAGRLVWSAEALAELAQLRGEWARAVARETGLAA